MSPSDFHSHTSKDLPTFKFALLGLLALTMVVFMGKSYEQSLQAMDSAIHARLALQVTSGGPLPSLPMKGLEAGWHFNDHPFPLFYLNGWLMRLLGADAWSARLLPSLFAVGCVLLTVWIGRLLYSPTMGLAAGLVLALNREMITYSARFQLDPALIFFILLSFIAWWKKKTVWMGISVGIGMWMKNPVSFLIFPSAFFTLLLTQTLNKKELKRLLVSSLIALMTGSLVWIFSGFLGNWEMVGDYWKRQVLGTAVGGRGHIQARDSFMWARVLLKTYYPWLPLLLMSLYLILKKKRWRQPHVAISLASSTTIVIVISLMQFKFPHYYLPMYPFLALLTVDSAHNWLERRKNGFEKCLIGSGLILPAFLMAMPIELSPEMFPALRRFNPIIQSYGSCQDKVLYIDGHQPYGSDGDYTVELGFYTNRYVIGVGCSDASAIGEREKPQWIMVSGPHLEQCLTEQLKKGYPVRYQFGNQYLLSNRINPEQALDLTPLARELKAPLDCDAAPLPHNRYHRYD